GKANAAPPSPDESATITSIRQFAGEIAAKRKKFLATLAEADMDRSIKVTRNNETWTLRLADVLLHVCNHGMHHRAQATTMQRALGLKPPLTEYIFMQVESPLDPQPQL